MKTILALLGSLSLLLSAHGATDAVDAELFPAEFLYTHRDALGVTAEQLQIIGGIMRESQPIFEEGKRQLGAAADAMQKVLRTDQPDEKEVDEKMHAVLDCEGEIKMLHLRTLLTVRAQLTSEQLAKARQLRDELMAKAAAENSKRERVDKKLEQLRAAIKARFPSGQVAPEVALRAKGIFELFTARKEADAEKEVDELLSQLGDGKAKP